MLKEGGSTDRTTAILKSVCRSCHGGCGALLHVRDGVLVKVEGDPQSPLNHGRLCPIGTVTTDLVYHPDRLKYPMRRPGRAPIWTMGAHLLGRSARRDLQSPARDPRAIWARSHRARHRHRTPSHPLGIAIRSRARHAELVRARLRAMLPSARQHQHPDLRRFSGVRLHRRRRAGMHHVLGPQPAQFRSGRRNALQRARGARTQPEDHRRRSAPHPPRRKSRPLAAAAAGHRRRAGARHAQRRHRRRDFTTSHSSSAGRTASTALAEHVQALHARMGRADHLGGGREDPRGRAPVRANQPAMLEWGCAIEHTPKCIQTVRAISMLPALTGNIDVPGGWVFGMHGIGRFPSLIEKLTPRSQCQAARRRPLQAARRRRRRSAGGAHPDAAAGHARGQALSGQGLSRYSATTR